METRSSKRQKLDPSEQEESKTGLQNTTVIIQFKNNEDQDVGFEISVPTSTSKAELNNLLSEVREASAEEDDH